MEEVNMLKTICFSAGKIACAALTLTLPALAQSYSVLEVPSLNGGFNQGNAINASGHIAGTSAGNPQQGFLYNGTSVVGVGVLSVPPINSLYSEAWGINASDEIVGETQTGEGYAMLYAGGKLVSLAPAGQSLSYALGINKTGQVVGYYATLGYKYSAFLWSPKQPNGTTGTLTTLSNKLGGTYSVGSGINDSGQVVGAATVANGNLHGFLYSAGKMIDLGTFGGIDSYALAINNAGQVVGWSDLSTQVGHAFLYSGGKMIDLGILPNATGSSATSINNSGEIVGITYYGSHVGQRRAALFTPSGPVDLNTLIPSGTGWILLQANGVNDAGQIVGTGLLNNNIRAFLLTPR
jgi:probable HAF family extracellular repeat protein